MPRLSLATGTAVSPHFSLFGFCCAKGLEGRMESAWGPPLCESIIELEFKGQKCPHTSPAPHVVLFRDPRPSQADGWGGIPESLQKTPPRGFSVL